MEPTPAVTTVKSNVLLLETWGFLSAPLWLSVGSSLLVGPRRGATQGRLSAGWLLPQFPRVVAGQDVTEELVGIPLCPYMQKSTQLFTGLATVLTVQWDVGTWEGRASQSNGRRDNSPGSQEYGP